jgi:hypothetical protein
MRSLAILSALSVTCTFVVVAGCAPAGECQAYNDCGADSYCNADRVCVSDPIDPGPPINPVVPGSDAGPNDGGDTGALQVRTRFNAVAWIQADPTTPGRILYPDFGEQSSTVNTDEVRGFDAATGAVEAVPVYRTLSMVDGVCEPDSIVDPGLDTDELWFNCARAPKLRTVYDNDASKLTQNDPALGSAHVVFATSPTGSEFPRRLFAERGGPLRSIQSRSADGLGTPHFTDTINVTLDQVVAIFPILRAQLSGDFALVHDKENNQLVPIERQIGVEAWAAAVQLDPLSLPADAHAVVMLGDVNATGSSQTSGEANIMTIHPDGGWLRFWNYESGLEIFPQTRFEPSATFQGPGGDASERLLLEWSPSGNYVFYTRQGTYRIWRLPLTGGAENDVRLYEFEQSDRRPSAIVPYSDDEVWISYGEPASENLIERVVVDQQP